MRLPDWAKRLLALGPRSVEAPARPIAARPGIKPCCLVPENRELLELVKVPQPNPEVEVHREVRACKVCGCKHHRMLVGKLQPGQIKVG